MKLLEVIFHDMDGTTTTQERVDISTCTEVHITDENHDPNTETQLDEQPPAKRQKMNESEYNFKTKTAKCLSMVIGNTKEVQRLDELRVKFKILKEDGKQKDKLNKLGTEIDSLFRKLKGKAAKKHEKLEKEVKQYELQHIKQHGLELPSLATDTHYRCLVHERNVAQKIIRGLDA